MPEYAIAGSYSEYMVWRAEDPKARGGVTFLNSAERARALIERGAPKGVLHRIGTWETSAALEEAEGLEAEAI